MPDKVNINPIVLFWRILVQIQDRFGMKPSLQKLSSAIYKARFGRKINWNDPKNLNEKICWLQHCGDTRLWPKLADKFEVRSFIMERGLEKFLVPLYGIWNTVDEIEWSALPDSFVLKTTNGSGGNIIVRDKSCLNEQSVKKKLNSMIKKRFGLREGEPHYLQIKNRILAEALLDDKNGYSSSIVDYKVWCFNGEPYCIMLCYDRNADFKIAMYDLEWNFIPYACIEHGHYHCGTGKEPKPAHLNEMLRAASILANGFQQVRVDFYDTPEGLYFGEMTMSSAGGLMPYLSQRFLDEAGAKINL